MAYTLDNKRTKNCCKRTILVQLNVEDVVTCFETVYCVCRQTKKWFWCHVLQCGPPWLRVFWQVFVCTCMLVLLSQHDSTISLQPLEMQTRNLARV